MTFFGELNNHINEILNKLLSSDILVNLVYYNFNDVLTKNTDGNFIHPVPTDKSILLYDSIYPYRHIPDSSTVGKTYVTMSFEDIRRNKNNPYFNIGKIYFYIICDSSKIRTDDGLRYFLIMDEISKLFDNQNIKGMGTLNLNDANIINIDNNNYTGYYMAFNICDSR